MWGLLMRKYNKWAALFGGWFGLHRYLSGEIGMGLLYTCTFAGSEGGQYHTTLSGCTCPDFQKRKVPCKHMYYLAIKCNIEI